MSGWRPSPPSALTFSLATMASHREAEVTQAPIAGPLAATMIGLGKSRKASNTAWLLILIKPCSFLGTKGEGYSQM